MIGISVALISIGWLCLRRTAIALILCFLLVGFVWRLVSAAYLDLAGPLYSYEVDQLVGGDSVAANMFGFLIALTVLTMAVVLRPSVFKRDITEPNAASGGRGLNLGDVVFGVSALFVAALFIGMYRVGIVPILDCVERFEYTQFYATQLHKALFKYGPIIALQMGTFAVYPRLIGGRYDWRYIILVCMLYIYLFITGNRFSGFYSLTFFFIMPLGLVLIRSTSTRGEKNRWRWASWKTIWFILPILGVLVVGMSILNSYANIRYEKSACADYRARVGVMDLAPSLPSMEVPGMTSAFPDITAPDVKSDEGLMGSHVLLSDFGLSDTLSRFISPEVQYKFAQRILIQPIHLFFLSWKQVIDRQDWRPMEAFDFIFNSEYGSVGNRGIRFLMNRVLPKERADYLEKVGNQFAGGYPEVFLELGGPLGIWLLVPVLAATTAWLLRLWVLAVLRGRFITSFFASYVCYAFFVTYIGGMLNYLIVWTFWAKVLLLVLSAFAEARAQRGGFSLLPWRVTPIFSR